MRMTTLYLGLVLSLAACDASPVEWTDPTATPSPAHDVRLTIDAAGARFVADTARLASLPSGPGVCASTLRTATGVGHVYAVWWNVRPDSTAVLVAASSANGGTSWTPPFVVDSTDVNATGCNRPPPAVTTVGDDLYTAYSMVAKEGTGVFFAHFMAGMFHAPVPVIYGDRTVNVAIAADGDNVAVAFEDPNGTGRRVQVALSRSQGHIFEVLSGASRDVDAAVAPAVALAGNRVAVAWKRAANPSDYFVRLGAITR